MTGPFYSCLPLTLWAFSFSIVAATTAFHSSFLILRSILSVNCFLYLGRPIVLVFWGGWKPAMAGFTIKE